MAAISACCFRHQISTSLKIHHLGLPSESLHHKKVPQNCNFAPNGLDYKLFDHGLMGMKPKQVIGCGFLTGSAITNKPNLERIHTRRKKLVNCASWMLSPEVIANNAFTLGTVAVLPFYTFMVVAPQAKITEKVVGSSIPYVVLGTLYAYLLYLSWTPDTVQLMFASKYWLPELPGIAKMFSSEMTLASAWIHLLAVDLFAARQVYFDGQQNNIETRHSVSLCLLFCPVGILAHFITKAQSKSPDKTEHGNALARKQNFH